MIRYLFASLGLVALVGVLYNPAASAQLSAGICVPELITTAAGVTTYTCEARAKFAAPAFTGVACSAPANGITLYAKLPDGTCLPIVPVAAPGFIADKLEFWYQHDTKGGYYAQSTFAQLTPKP